MFATDRDLLVLEPTLMRDVGFAGQTLARATGSLTSGTLTISGADLANLRVENGSIVSVDGAPMEVLARLSAVSASVSLLRGSVDDPAVIPGNATSKPVVFTTFKPQLSMAHDQILRLIGIEPGVGATALGGETGEPALSEGMIVNPRGLKLLECLGALHLIYASASGVASGDGVIGERAAMYRERFVRERARVTVLIDRDGDGVAESRRMLSVMRLARV